MRLTLVLLFATLAVALLLRTDCNAGRFSRSRSSRSRSQSRSGNPPSTSRSSNRRLTRLFSRNKQKKPAGGDLYPKQKGQVYPAGGGGVRPAGGGYNPGGFNPGVGGVRPAGGGYNPGGFNPGAGGGGFRPGGFGAGGGGFKKKSGIKGKLPWIAAGVGAGIIGPKLLKKAFKRPKFGHGGWDSSEEYREYYGPYRTNPRYRDTWEPQWVRQDGNGTFIDCDAKIASGMFGTFVNIYGTVKGPMEFLKHRVLCFLPKWLPFM